MTQEILTSKQVAIWLQLTPKTIRAMAARGEIPSFTIGTQIRFHRCELLRWSGLGKEKE
jgi:excisionase family DNA binding protein